MCVYFFNKENIEQSESDNDSDIETLEYDPNINWKEELKRDYGMLCKKAMLLACCGKSGGGARINNVDCLCDFAEPLNMLDSRLDDLGDPKVFPRVGNIEKDRMRAMKKKKMQRLLNLFFSWMFLILILMKSLICIVFLLP